MSYLSLKERRVVNAANFNYYPKPVLHLDRIMAEHDLVYVVQGEWEILQENIRYTAEAGDVLFLEAGKHHWGEIPCSAGTRTMFIHCSALPLDGMKGEDAAHIPALTKAAFGRCGDLFRQIIDAYWSESSHWEIRAAALLDLLLCELVVQNQRPQEQWPVNAVRHLLMQRPDQNYTAAELAAELQMSERRLRYLFAKNTDKPLHRFQLELKLEMVRQIIAIEPERTLADLAHAYGFADEFHLSKAYKKYYGQAPRAPKNTL